MSSTLLQQLQASLGGEYLLERELGGGVGSRVFLAEERRFGRRVVVKVLNPELVAGISADRFEREIRLAASLQNPRIVPVLRAGRVGQLPYYTMPYVEGESLGARLTAGPLDTGEAIEILRDIALALDYAHAHHVVHRDIKPANILLSGHTAMVTDFGIAKAISAATLPAASTLTSAGMIVGTPAYMAPEQATDGVIDARADLYAWGVVAYEILAGVHPFAGRTSLQAILAAQVYAPPVSLAERRPDLPVALTTLVDECLAGDVDARPASAAALIRQLDRALGRAPSRVLPWRVLIPAGAAMLVLLGAAGLLYLRSEHRSWARDVAVPNAEKLRDADRDLAAFLLLKRAEAYVPADTQVARVAAEDSRRVSITSSPAGADVSIQDYTTPDGAWYRLGITPLRNVRVPAGYFRWKVAKRGVGEYVTAPLTGATMRFALDSSLAAPAGMVRVPARSWWDLVSFVGWVGPFRLPAFFMDRYEVTNQQYQKFVDAGGYETPKYWTEPFIRNGHVLSREQAMALFRDRTGRPGPATWEGGHYPDGKGDYPVSGVSWYEAAAYAAFVGKSLPALAQWYEAAPSEVARDVVQQSNISRSRLAPVGAFHGLGPYGTYDMAGNVREWTLNALDVDHRFILGGDWTAPTYLSTVPESLSPFDRSAGNGIRCVLNVEPLPPAATRPVKPQYRDFSTLRPVSDAVFRAYEVMYSYDRTPLDVKDEGVVADTKDWREEKVSFAAAYGNERLAAYLFLPKRVRPPYQTVVFFPSARVLDIPDSRRLGDISFFDYVVQSGRAVIYPVYQDTYERRLRHTLPGTANEREIVLQRSKDLGRTLDYLATRSDIDTTRVAYLGVSMGAAEGVIYATIAQSRLRAVVLLDGGFFLNPPAPGVDQADFAPRLTKPVLMVNGRYDFSFPLEQAQKPLFDMLGTPRADKEHVVLETPHDVGADRPALVKAVLGWLDRYLGRVE